MSLRLFGGSSTLLPYMARTSKTARTCWHTLSTYVPECQKPLIYRHILLRGNSRDNIRDNGEAISGGLDELPLFL